MDGHKSDLSSILVADTPARPFLVFGGLLGLVGLMRTNLAGLVLLGAGIALLGRGVEEARKTMELHGGNAHGVNAPPANG